MSVSGLNYLGKCGRVSYKSLANGMSSPISPTEPFRSPHYILSEPEPLYFRKNLCWIADLSLRPSTDSSTMSSSDFDNVRFPSGKETCAAWLFPAHRPSHTDKSTKSPAIILGHGLGGVKEMGLDRYSARFQAAGYTCLAFDYRYFGGSTGSPRRLVDLNRQTEDWSAALDYMMTVAGVDTERIALFGTSQGGGLVISVADKEKRRVKAVVSQCPLTSGIGSVMQKGPIDSVQLTSLAIADWLYSWVGGVVHVRVAGRPNQRESTLHPPSSKLQPPPSNPPLFTFHPVHPTQSTSTRAQLMSASGPHEHRRLSTRVR